MNLSLTSFLTTMVSGSILVIVLFFICTNKKIFYKMHYSLLLGFTFTIVIRLLLPFETKYTITIPLQKFFPQFVDALSSQVLVIDKKEIYLFQLISIVAICGSIVFVLKLIFQYMAFLYLIHQLKSTIDNNIDTPKYEFVKTENQDAYKKITIIEANSIKTPEIVGIINPIILLPKGNLTENELGFIVQHELQHFKNHDLFLKLGLEFLYALCWWNPLVFILKRQLYNFLELRVDAMIAENWSPYQRIEYLECLVKIYKQKEINEERLLAIGLVEKNEDFIIKRTKYFLRDPKKPSVVLVILLCGMILLSSFAVIFEPMSIYAEDAKDTFALTDESYIIERAGEYSLYIDNQCIGIIENPFSKEFENIPIYKKLK